MKTITNKWEIPTKNLENEISIHRVDPKEDITKILDIITTNIKNNIQKTEENKEALINYYKTINLSVMIAENYSIVLKLKKEIIGFLSASIKTNNIYINSPYINIEQIYINHNHKNIGTGSKLINFFEDQMMEKYGLATINVKHVTDSAKEFYEKNGYKYIQPSEKKILNGNTSPTIHYQKKLS